MSCSNKSGPTDQWGFVSGLRGRELRTPEMLKAVMSKAYVCCGAFQQHLVWEMAFWLSHTLVSAAPDHWCFVSILTPVLHLLALHFLPLTLLTNVRMFSILLCVSEKWNSCILWYTPKIACLDQPEFFQALMLRMKKREPRIQNLCPVVIKDILFSIQTKRHPYYAGLFLEIF